jgi:hypothetical protein
MIGRVGYGPNLVAVALTTVAVRLSAQGPPHRVAREDLRLGGVNATEAAAFIDEPKLMVDYDGHIYALTTHDVRVFDTDGTALMTLGRDGNGPGEFRSAGFMGFLADTLWVIDTHWRPARISRFLRSTGKLLDTAPRDSLRDEGDPTVVWKAMALLQDGHVFAMGDDAGYMMTQPTERERIHLAVARGHLTHRTDLGSLLFPGGLFIPGHGSLAFGPFPDSPLYMVYADGSGVVTVTWGEHDPPGVNRVRVYDPRGKKQVDEVPVTRQRAVPGRVRDSLVADGVKFFTPVMKQHKAMGLPVSANLEDAVRKGLPIPAIFFEFQQVVAGIDGSLWLQAMRSFGDTLWEALDARGRPAFTVAMPSGFTLKQASLREVWGTAKGEYDGPRILRYHIEDER